MKHSDCTTHINNEEDEVYLRTKHFPVNMRLFKTSPMYKDIILQQCNYIRHMCLTEKEGYKKPHGMSSANAGLSFNIIAFMEARNTPNEFCRIMINPEILQFSGNIVDCTTNCGSLTLDKPIVIQRYDTIKVRYYDVTGTPYEEFFTRSQGSLTIQHEIDHNLGILILDKIKN